MRKILLFLILITCTSLYAQQYAYFDFGNAGNDTTGGNWNNVTLPGGGTAFNVMDFNGTDTNIVFTLSDSFNSTNTTGTESPDETLQFPVTATKDSFFGSVELFNGAVVPTGGFTLTGLDPTKYYSFSIFSSRVGVSDNREALYTVIGSTLASESLNASNNTSNTADILNIQSTASGEITFQAEPGVNNNNSLGFYYLGAIQFIISDTPITTTIPEPELTLNYPNGGHLWEVNKTVRVKWVSVSVQDMLIEFSSDNGFNWTTIGTVAGSQQYYEMVVPDVISADCLIRISGEGLSDVSENVFETIPNEGVVYKIVVLGSSTAAGAGPSNVNDAWVWKYDKYLTEMDTRYEVENLAVGGFATYNVLPTGTAIPAGVNTTVNVEKNITKALDLQANGIIVNLPSNDAANGFPVVDQLYNYGLISADAANADIPMWVATPQPRNFGASSTKLAIQLQMITETYTMFGDKTIDFWTGFGEVDDNGILPAYDSGDGVHMNSAAHQILYDRVIGMDIHTQVKDVVDEVLSVEDNEIVNFVLYPNPISQQATLKFNEYINGDVNISVVNVLGEVVENQNYEVKNQTISWNRNELVSGVYFMIITNKLNRYTKKIFIKTYTF